MGFMKELKELMSAPITHGPTIITWAKNPEELARYNYEMAQLSQQQVKPERENIEWQHFGKKSRKGE